MKFSVIFVFAAFAFVAHVHAKPVAHETLDRGVVADALKIKLKEAKDKLDELVNKAQDVLKTTIVELRQKAENLIDQIKDKATEVTDDLYEAAQKILDRCADVEDEVIEQGKKLADKYGK